MTTPTPHDLDGVEAGLTSEAAYLRERAICNARERNAAERENAALRIAFWNFMRSRGVSQDDAIQIIRKATEQKQELR